jgi:hypothetical protein
MLEAAAETGADVAVLGGWQRATLWHPVLRKLVRGRGVWDEDHVIALNATRIGLDLLKKRSGPDSSATRTFEIRACGTFLLADQFPEHGQLFEEERGPNSSTDTTRCGRKITWYVGHDEEREPIAAAGRERCLRSGY